MKISNLIQLVRKEDATLRKLDDDYFILHGEDAYEVNETGATIFNALGRDMSIKELCTRLSQKYDSDDSNQIERDAYVFIDFLISEDLVGYA